MSSVKSGDTVELFAVWTTAGFGYDVELDAKYHLKQGIIDGYTGEAKDVIVPAYFREAELGAYSVVYIRRPIFKDNSEIVSIKNFPASDIEDQMFYGCTSLKSFKSRRAIDSIGKQAFYNNEKL